MNVPKQEAKVHGNNKAFKVPSKDISQRHISKRMSFFFTAVRISCIVTLVFWILSVLFKPDISEVIVVILVLLIFLSAVLNRYIRFYCRYTSLLGFITELSFILGVAFYVIGATLGYSYSIQSFLLFSFVIAPCMGILNRAIKIKRGETRNIYHTITEMFILGIPVVIAVWTLLKVW